MLVSTMDGRFTDMYGTCEITIIVNENLIGAPPHGKISSYPSDYGAIRPPAIINPAISQATTGNDS